jgi:hypothetical protein
LLRNICEFLPDYMAPHTKGSYHFSIHAYIKHHSTIVIYIIICFLIYPNLFRSQCHQLGSKIKQTPWPESESELYRPSDRRLSAKLEPTFADRGVSRSQSGGSLRRYSRLSRPEPLIFLLSSS